VVVELVMEILAEVLQVEMEQLILEVELVLVLEIQVAQAVQE
jgi:hypothetical protein